ncbi:protein kinase [Phytophthora infestans T30-4]|uniref:non-specific serine/threonine protein kinase n=1 Tax=Phytophthora infestans (strain T30-4) TaxID=403677 RepID=D0NTW1_PHYIT|nr:protein kinase [Phytophthora infestans T30-4]EEY65073.1 protein kinase [Phytophthora infestans T30-4]|eukprot:XP_002897561.1 protein kinase [Phytophthora infestans T30-4]
MATLDLPTKSRDGYKQLAHIGRGTYGDVFLCEHVESEDHKLKLLNVYATMSRMRCLTEVELLYQLPEHPNIVGFREAFWVQSPEGNQQVLALVLEHADGGDLEQYLRLSQVKEEDVRRIFLQLVQGVSHLHRNRVIHRDLKSSNVFLFKSGRVVLGDFGTSKLLQTTEPDQALEAQGLTSTVVGSPLYMSPELLEDESHGFATDIWSLGCVLYEMLSGGKAAFNAPSYPAVVFRITQGDYDPLDTGLVSLEVRDLVARMLQKDPKSRINITEVHQSPWLMVLTSTELRKIDSPLHQQSTQGVVTASNCQETIAGQQIPATSIVQSTQTSVLPPPAPIVNKIVEVSPPPAPQTRKAKASVWQTNNSRRKRKEADRFRNQVASPLIRLDEQPPPPPMLPSRANFSTGSTKPLKLHHLDHRNLPRQRTPDLEIRGVHITGTARRHHSALSAPEV